MKALMLTLVILVTGITMQAQGLFEGNPYPQPNIWQFSIGSSLVFEDEIALKNRSAPTINVDLGRWMEINDRLDGYLGIRGILFPEWCPFCPVCLSCPNIGEWGFEVIPTFQLAYRFGHFRPYANLGYGINVAPGNNITSNSTTYTYDQQIGHGLNYGAGLQYTFNRGIGIGVEWYRRNFSLEESIINVDEAGNNSTIPVPEQKNVIQDNLALKLSFSF